MNAKEVLQQLKDLGTEQNRKIYRRHGAGERVFGVSFANLGKLRKQIKQDHELALRLWASGHYEARVLATMIADPARADGPLLDAWMRDMDNDGLAGYVSELAAKTPLARAKMKAWTASDAEWIGTTGWMLLGRLAMDDATLPDDFFEERLRVIERDIHTSKNSVKGAMNMTLIAIGVRNPALRKMALAAAKQIGKVEVDHGETGCKTPDAAAYIQRAVEHQSARTAVKRRV